jgi:hypothetical protein
MVELLRNFLGIDQDTGRRDPSWWSGIGSALTRGSE